MSLGRGLAALFAREARLAYGQGGGGAAALGFFLAAVGTAPLALGAGADVLAPVAGGFIWMVATLAALASLDRFFQADFEDGALEPLALGPLPLELIALVKAAAFWATALGPIILFAPIAAILLRMAPEAIPVLVLSLLVGTPAVALLGAAGAALAVGVRRGGVLIALIILPLFAPILIFGAGAAAADEIASAPMLFLGAYSLFCLVICPIAAGAGLRLNLE